MNSDVPDAADLEFPMRIPFSMLPMRIRPTRPLSDDELQRLCERQETLHIEREPDGELDVRAIGGWLASSVGIHVSVQLGDWADKNGGHVLSNVGFFLPDGSMRGPRIAWISADKWQRSVERDNGGFVRDSPEFVIEILSLNYTHERLREKMHMYIANGVERAWLIDPTREMVEIYRPNREPESPECGSSVGGVGPVAGFVLDLARVWG